MKKGSIYNHYEENWMETFYKYKGIILSPFVKILTLLRIRAVYLSVLEIIVCLSLLFYQTPQLVLLIFFIHFILDGLDGALARYQKDISSFGGYIDVICDQFCFILILYGIMMLGYVSVSLTFFYALLYTIVVIISFIRNLSNIGTFSLFRSRLVVYFIFVVDVIFNIKFGVLFYDIMFGVFIGIMVVQLLVAVVKIGRHLER